MQENYKRILKNTDEERKNSRKSHALTFPLETAMYFLMHWLQSSSYACVLCSSGPCHAYSCAACLFHSEHNSFLEHHKPFVNVAVMIEQIFLMCLWTQYLP